MENYKNCLVCGDTFTPYKKENTVCQKCRDAKLKPKICKDVTCKTCGKIFTQKGYRQSVCEECKPYKKQKQPSYKPKPCGTCGTIFTPPSSTSKECPDCKAKSAKWLYDVNRMIPCVVCGKEFNPVTKNKTKCSDECKREYARLACNKRRTSIREDLYTDKVENVDYVVCKICGNKSPQLDNHLRVHNLTTEQYLELYPDAKMCSEKFSLNVSGENNPNSISNTTEEERRSRSPFCDSFYETKGIDLSVKDEMVKRIHKDMVYRSEERRVGKEC